MNELKTSINETDILEKIEKEINKVEAGIIGEKQIHFELENSHIPMFILHDLFIEHDGLKAQIDYMVLTRKNVYIIECKNLYGNIEINSTGSFVRTYKYNNHSFKEGIYSPITQNQRHLELIKDIISESKKNLITKALFESKFHENYHSIVVLANPKTVLNDRYAKKEIKQQVIRADQLVSYILKKDAEKDSNLFSEKEMSETAEFFLSINKKNPIDYSEKFRKNICEKNNNAKEDMNKTDINIDVIAPKDQSTAGKGGSLDCIVEQKDAGENIINYNDNGEKPDNIPICPKCGAPMVLRTAKKGDKIGNKFYGCSTFPKCKGIINIQM